MVTYKETRFVKVTTVLEGPLMTSYFINSTNEVQARVAENPTTRHLNITLTDVAEGLNVDSLVNEVLRAEYGNKRLVRDFDFHNHQTHYFEYAIR